MLAAVSVERDSAVASLHSAREETARIKAAAREREAREEREGRARGVAVYAVDGMGQLLLPGPSGPLSTLHFEAHRDGFEDHAMLTLLRTVVQNASRLHVDCASEAKAL